MVVQVYANNTGIGLRSNEIHQFDETLQPQKIKYTEHR
jgi:hypothetical protein